MFKGRYICPGCQLEHILDWSEDPTVYELVVSYCHTKNKDYYILGKDITQVEPTLDLEDTHDEWKSLHFQSFPLLKG